MKIAVSVILYTLIRFYVFPLDKYEFFEYDSPSFSSNQLKNHFHALILWYQFLIIIIKIAS